MIRKLKIKFLLIVMTLFTIIILFVFGSINIAMYKAGENQSFQIMKIISQNDGDKHKAEPPDHMLPPLPPEVLRGQNSFSVILDKDNKILDIISDVNIEYTREQLIEFTNEVLDKKIPYGIVSSSIKFLSEPKPYGKIIVFLDTSFERSIRSRLIWISAAIGFISLLVIFVITLYLSSWAIKPVQTAFNKQKQFIADASHELKTPLTVINANIDVLSANEQGNKWLDYIKAETERMSSLVNNLLYLAKVDNAEDIYFSSDFSLSEAVTAASLAFESIVFEAGKTLNLKIEDNIFIKGDENKLKQVVMILLDNAVKNSDDDGIINISLKLTGNKKIIEVTNTGYGIAPEDIDKIFERFYRADKSRARLTGGFGLGLSIAKAIVEEHNGKIYAESELGKGAVFTVVL